MEMLNCTFLRFSGILYLSMASLLGIIRRSVLVSLKDGWNCQSFHTSVVQVMNTLFNTGESLYWLVNRDSSSPLTHALTHYKAHSRSAPLTAQENHLSAHSRKHGWTRSSRSLTPPWLFMQTLELSYSRRSFLTCWRFCCSALIVWATP